MINELKRIWRNYKYYFIFLIVIEILLLVEFKAERIFVYPAIEYKIIFGTFIQLFTLISFFFFNHFKSNLNDFELVLPFARIKTFLYRNILFITYFFTLYILKNLFILKINEFYAWIPNLFICLLFIFTIYIYFMNFRKPFFVYTSVILILFIILVFAFGIKFDKVFLSLTISVIESIIIIFIVLFLYPLFMYFFNYIKNQGYQKSIIKRTFLAITFLLILSFLIPVLTLPKYYSSFYIRSGHIQSYSSIYVSYYGQSIVYSIYDKIIISDGYLEPIICYENKYGSITRNNWYTLTINTDEYTMVCTTVPNSYKIRLNKIYNIKYIYAYKDSKLYKINLTNFKREVILNNITSADYTFDNKDTFYTKDGNKYFLTYKNGLVKLKFTKYNILWGIDDYYFYNYFDENEVLDFDGNLIYKLENSEWLYEHYPFRIYNVNNNIIKIFFKGKILEFPSDYHFVRNKFAYYYIEKDNIILKNLENNTIIAEFTSPQSDEKDLSYAKIISLNNNYYLCISGRIKIPFRKLYKKSEYYKYLKYGKILIYKAVDGKFVLYDTIN